MFVARDRGGLLRVHRGKPERDLTSLKWTAGLHEDTIWMASQDEGQFKDLTWDDESVEVVLVKKGEWERAETMQKDVDNYCGQCSSQQKSSYDACMYCHLKEWR